MYVGQLYRAAARFISSDDLGGHIAHLAEHTEILLIRGYVIVVTDKKRAAIRIKEEAAVVQILIRISLLVKLLEGSAKGYAPLRFRTWFVPIANFGSKLAWPLILLGVFINSQSSQMIIDAGIFLFSFAVIFQLVTLPVEFNASSRALEMLSSLGILHGEENDGAKKVLGAAALTYVAAAAASILQLLRLIILFGGRGRRDD